MLEFREAQRLSGGSDAIIVPVKIVEDRVDRAPNVHLRHGCHHDAKLEVAPVSCFEWTLLTFAHLVLLSCINEIPIYETHQQRESGLRVEAAETVRDVDATRVDTGQFSEREVERCSAPARLGQVQKSSGTVSLSARLEVVDLQLEMQRLREFTSATEL